MHPCTHVLTCPVVYPVQQQTSMGKVTPKVGQSALLLSEVQNTRFNNMGEWLAQQVREKAAEKQESRRREIALDQARCQAGLEQEANEKAAELRKRQEATQLLRASWAAQARGRIRRPGRLLKAVLGSFAHAEVEGASYDVGDSPLAPPLTTGGREAPPAGGHAGFFGAQPAHERAHGLRSGAAPACHLTIVAVCVH